MYRIRLNYAPGVDQLYFRDLCGADELSVTATRSADAIQLLNRLVIQNSTTGEAEEVISHLPIAERDYILSAVYQRIYGSKVESTIRCQACNEPFDLDFSLPELIEHLWSTREVKKDWYQEDGTFKTDKQLHFRLPTGQDEMQVAGLAPEAVSKALLEKCLMSSSSGKNAEKDLEVALEEVAPLIETKLASVCPECNVQQEILFSIQTFLLKSLLQEQKQVLVEVHRIATIYHWSHAEIMNLPRSIRKAYARLIEQEFE